MVIGGVDDQISILVWERLSVFFQQLLISNPYYNHIFSAFINPLSTNEPLTYSLLKVFMILFKENSYNLFLMLTVITNLFVSYLFFKRYKYALFLTIVFSFSAFFWLHIGKHISLAELWTVPLFFIFIERLNNSFRSYLYFGIVLSSTILISNYLGFGLLVYTIIYFLCGLITRKIGVREIKGLFITLFSAGLVVVVSLFPYISANYFNKIPTKADSSLLVLKRPIDDFLLFSARPWYFFIPPIKNVLYGDFPTRIYSSIASTGYFLADDYFDGEHGSLFIGYSLLVFIGFSIFRAYKYGDKSVKSKLIINLLCIGILLLFMLPPYFTVSGITIYTPGWLIYKFFPMFRVTTRFIVVILFVSLSIAGDILTRLPIRGKKGLLVYLLLPLILIETYVPLKVAREEVIPEELTQLRNYLSQDSFFATYPYNFAKQAFYYLPTYERILINPRGLVYGDFDSEKFTSGLITNEGLDKARVLGVKYILVYKDIPSKELEFFENNKLLRKEGDFHSAYLFGFSN